MTTSKKPRKQRKPNTPPEVIKWEYFEDLFENHKAQISRNRRISRALDAVTKAKTLEEAVSHAEEALRIPVNAKR